jgi:hypothetical protein
MELNFDEAIAAHSIWKQKLAIYLAKPNKSIDSGKLAQDHHCELGKWIHGQQGPILSNPTFQELKKEHASFHQAAAEVVKKADSGQKVSEEISLGAKSPYASCSSKVISALVKMKRESANAA